MQHQYNYQLFFNQTSKKCVLELLKNLDLPNLLILDQGNKETYVEFYTDKLEDLPEEDKSFQYRIFDHKNEEYIKIEKFFFN